MSTPLLKAAFRQLITQDTPAPTGQKVGRSFRLHDQTAKQLDEIAQRLGTSRTAIVEQSINDLHHLIQRT